MHVAILAPGSRGDVQPHVALARALIARGHGATLIADPVFAALAARHGVPFAGAAFDTRQVLEDEQEALGRVRNPIAALRGLTRRGAELADAWSAAAIPVCRETDLILAAGGAIYMALSLSEALNKPAMQSALQPFYPTRAFPSPLLPPRNWPGFGNLLSHHAIHLLFYVMFRRSTNQFRAQLGLAPWPTLPRRWLRHPTFRALCAVSRHVVPPPGDMPDFVRPTGYWFLDDGTGWSPPPALAAFLAAGPPPVYIGFGSMADRAAGETTTLVLSALERSGQRAILARGWGGLTEVAASPRAIAIDEAPHDRLLPLCAGAVHHGGAGTTAAAIRAGLPQVLIPTIADQPFWADRTHRLGVATPPIPKRALTADRLAGALARLAADNGLANRAAALAEAVRGENGLQAAVAEIEGFMRENGRKNT